ncbi:MAG: hypothetical protein ACLFUB_17610 [Cyclobacteriaceae bacterium]
MKKLLYQKIRVLFLFLPVLSGLYACNDTIGGPPVSASQHFRQDWAMDPLWDQGDAEVAIYDARRMVYGEARSFEYAFILVKETFNEEFKVKADDYSRSDLFEVMKINKFCRIPTDNYPYHYLTSIFYLRQQPSTVYKLTNTSQEWCGNTSKYFLHEGEQYRFGYNSYWDGQGIGETSVQGDIMFEDQLSHSLRALNFQEGLTFRQAVAESQVNSKAEKPKIYDARFSISRADDLILQTGYETGQEEIWKVSVQLDDEKTSHYWFSGTYPNLLLKQESWNGRSYELKEHKMDAYWERGSS